MAQTIKKKLLHNCPNERGEVKMKIFRLTNSKDEDEGIRFDIVNAYYQQLLEQYKATDLVITAKPLDGGYVTLKAQSYDGENLKHQDESYYENLPKEVRDKLQGSYYSVDIAIMIESGTKYSTRDIPTYKRKQKKPEKMMEEDE